MKVIAIAEFLTSDTQNSLAATLFVDAVATSFIIHSTRFCFAYFISLEAMHRSRSPIASTALQFQSLFARLSSESAEERIKFIFISGITRHNNELIVIPSPLV